MNPMVKLGTAEQKVELADEYFSAASALRKCHGAIQPISSPLMFLFAHALELLLKAYVELKAPDDRKKYRHALGLLWQRAETLGLLKDDDAARSEVSAVVSYLREGHEAYQFRYADESFITSGPVMTEAAIRKARTAIRQEVAMQREMRKSEAESKGMVLVDIPVGARISIEGE